MRDVAIVIHRRERWDELPYHLRAIVSHWPDDLRVRVLQGPAPRVEADVAFLHVNLTVAPEDHVAFVARHRVAVNGAVADISKRRFSEHLVRRGEIPEGPVIVKTDGNAGGQRDMTLAARGSVVRRMLRRKPLRALGRVLYGRPLVPPAYRVFDSVREVPPAVWGDPALIVERFLPERRDGQYCVRNWVFLGDRETNSIAYSDHPLVKSTNAVRRVGTSEVPDELRRKRKELGFDFGKFDYGIVDGRVVLYDVNRTPMISRHSRTWYEPRIPDLAEGIHALLASSPAV